MAGRYFDEWQVGDRVAHAITRTVTETDNVLISTLTHNPQPLHLDHEAAAKTEFGKPLVNSLFTFSLMVGVSVADTTLGTLVANLGYDKLIFPNPVFAGDTLAQRKRVHRAARKQVAAERRDRHLGAPQLQPARRAGVRMHAHRAAAEEAAMTEPRSWLFVPADSEKKIAKALDSDADAIIFDLEDSVAPAQKAAAREILEGSAASGPAARNGGCAINPLGSEYHKDDLDADRQSPTSTASSCPRPKAAPTSPSSRTAPATSRSTPSSPRPRRACSACSPIATRSRRWRR